MRKKVPDLTEVLIKAGHWVAWEKPEETNAAIVSWLEKKVPGYSPKK